MGKRALIISALLIAVIGCLSAGTIAIYSASIGSVYGSVTARYFHIDKYIPVGLEEKAEISASILPCETEYREFYITNKNNKKSL